MFAVNKTRKNAKVPSTNEVQENAAEITVSVIIPCFNSAGTIRQALDALQSQKTRYAHEVIVVDSSRDETPQIITREYPDVRLLRREQQTYPGTARNLGIEAARGKYVAFTDSDCVPAPDWIERLIEAFEETGAGAVGGCLINGYPLGLTTWVNHLIEFNEWTETTPAGYVTNIPSANLAYRREVFRNTGVHYPDFLGSEDTILNWKMRQKGVKLFFDPRVRVVHMNRVGLRKLFRHQYMLGRWSAEARRRENLPGQFFTRYKILAFGLPVVRWLRAFSRLVRKDPLKLIIFVATTPLYLAAATVWSAGFVSGQKLEYSPGMNRGAPEEQPRPRAEAGRSIPTES